MTTPTREPTPVATYARALRRRWKLIVGVVVLTLAAALAVLLVPQTPARPATTERVRPAWTATTTLMRSPELEVNLQTIATLATLGEIPDRVATDLGVDKDALVSALTVEVGGDAPAAGGSGARSGGGSTTSQAPASGQRSGTAGGTTSRASTSDFLTVTASGASADAATSAADAVAAELIEWTVQDATAAHEEDTGRLAAEIERLRTELEEMEAAAASEDGTGDVVSEEGPAGRGAASGGGERSSSAAAVAYEVKLQEYGRLLGEQEEAADAPGGRPGLEVVEPAVAVRVPPPPAADALLPSGRRARLAGAGILGLLGAVALALVLDRLDGRLYTTSDVRGHVPHTVMGAIGRLSRRERRTGDLRDRSAEAFRMLAAKLLAQWRGGQDGAAPVRTVMVVGARAGAGATTITRNLAIELSELGTRVLVLDCDMRIPTSRSARSAKGGRGLAQVLQGPPRNGSRVIDAIEHEQLRDGLRVLRSGQASGNRAALLGSERMARALTEASDGAEVVLLDAPPLLEVTDAAPLVSRVDLVLLAVRAGRTTAAEATDVVELLDTLGARDVAVVVSGAEDASAVDLHLPWSHHDPHRRGGNPRLVRQTVDA